MADKLSSRSYLTSRAGSSNLRPRKVITSFTETGQAESSVKVPLQRVYTGRNLAVIPSSLADTPCATLGVQGILAQLNATLETSHTFHTPYLFSLLEGYIKNNYDFGTAYGHLRTVWKTNDPSTIREELRKSKEKDEKRRREALVGNRVVDPWLQPRRVWDLWSNRVVPYWAAGSIFPVPISHAWVDASELVGVWTVINGKEWPAPLPKDANLNLIRIEMLNWAWKGLRLEEWKLDVPTIGRVYWHGRVVIYLSGLGRAVGFGEGDLESERCWFRRAWTLQEVGHEKILAGDTPDGPLHAKPIDRHGNYASEILTRFHKQLELVYQRSVTDFSGALTDMQQRVSTNPVDKIAGLAFPLWSNTIPAYDGNKPLEDAWVALVDSMNSQMRADFLFLYPQVGRGDKRWRPTGLVRGLDVGPVQGRDRCGELVVQGTDGMARAFEILVTHQSIIPEGTYTLLGSYAWDFEGNVARPQYWTIGKRLSHHRFQKVSVSQISNFDEITRLANLGIINVFPNVLV
ncbi:hypothetical protein EDD18DRAFT_1178439 [Armillaria luteobubalina]|uniref:Uncharacterized protein n=1 Tax=Armillaria luteobubalina TaxID=153913 RepID=A0AA39Q0G5_9AGAR|nr:hypothetical protein EDD18DRAFT_1178439 [Armillaria luteobubalina]